MGLPPSPDRFGKLGIVLPKLVDAYKSLINPGEDLTLDESLLAFKGRLSIKQYNPLKSAQTGIKLFLLADAKSGYVCGILPYQGKATAIINQTWLEDYGFGGASVLSLVSPYFYKWHRVTVDNWFVSVKLARKLLELKTHILGTVKRSRKGIPKMTNKLRKGEVDVYSDGQLLLER